MVVRSELARYDTESDAEQDSRDDPDQHLLPLLDALPQLRPSSFVGNRR